ncbi:SDR family oxidoreductase [Rhodopirellula sp. MGV]|uniref:SDR family oxidoreductase n=1 Tax=Rhodopirellula sp. MGV TaxID=2023130 RepID=UPI000B96E443|nr:SDR family NAD(P)-dependent oxidoreductase [Rhodopirellula sp. MGV]OYP38823.1 3-oxoacyl-[acyl-carrier-protein] reductase [Rhodopirellula sp. MGV]PNY37634.1 SDR family NAD(P)-dependent oxidoreductase [Rhodopirellula baltica]
MKIDLSDEVILVTGGSEGIGAGIAKCCADCGARVAVLARDQRELQDVVDEIESDGGSAMLVVADVTDETEMKTAIEQVVEHFGKLTGLVANAGTNGTWTPIDEMSPEEWRSTIDVNLTGTYLAIHFSVPFMRHAGRGGIVIMSSINGTRTFSNEGASAYASSKAGQYALGKMLALELAPSNIRVNVVCPGAITSGIHAKTERDDLEKIETPVEYPEGDIPLTRGEYGKPHQVAELTAFLLSGCSGHITGSPVWIDGGQSLIV